MKQEFQFPSPCERTDLTLAVHSEKADQIPLRSALCKATTLLGAKETLQALTVHSGVLPENYRGFLNVCAFQVGLWRPQSP